MEDDKLKELFGGFNPELSPDNRFMDRLLDNMRSVELIRQHNAEQHRRNRIAVAVAAFAGFLCGILFSLLLPYFGNAMTQLASSVTLKWLSQILIENNALLGWLIISSVSVTIAINTYDITAALLRRRAATATARSDF